MNNRLSSSEMSTLYSLLTRALGAGQVNIMDATNAEFEMRSLGRVDKKAVKNPLLIRLVIRWTGIGVLPEVAKIAAQRVKDGFPAEPEPLPPIERRPRPDGYARSVDRTIRG